MDNLDMIFKETHIFYNVLCFLISENEKVFERSDKRLYWKTVFHLTVFYHHCYVGLFALGLDLRKSDNEKVVLLRTYKECYLTGWNFAFQTCFLFLACSYDILEWLQKTETKVARRLQFLRDVSFNGLVVPFSCFVSAMFWSIYWIDRELVFPKVFDDICPWWFNHCVHTNILVVIGVETLLQPRRRPTSLAAETLCVTVVNLAYAVVYYSIFFITNQWLYDVFGTMNWWQVCLYQLLIWSSAFFFYWIHFPINRLIHGSVDEGVEENGDLYSEKIQYNGSVKESDKTVDSYDVNGKKRGNNDEKSNGVTKTDVSSAMNGISDRINTINGKLSGSHEKINDRTIKVFADKTWSKKYRSIRNQFENKTDR